MSVLRQLAIAFAILLLTLSAVPARALELPLQQEAGKHGGIRVDNQRIATLLASYLADQADNLPKAKVRFREISAIQPLNLPAGSATCEVIPADPAIIGSRSVSLIFRVDGRVVANLPLHVEIEALAKVAVAAVDLPRGAVLAKGDVYLAERDLSELREPYLAIAALPGKRLRRALRAGEPLQKSLVDTPPLVRRGDLVTMTVHRGALLLTAQGIATDNGAAGDTIRVRNSSSQKEVHCRVAGPGDVEVEL